MVSVTEVFVPSDFPTYTYVERGNEPLERDMRQALRTPRSPISISGPSKTGKTALVKKIVGEDNLIHIFGSQIESAGDLWVAILNWMDVPSSVSRSETQSETLAPSASISATMKVPLVASVTLGGGLSTTTSGSGSTTQTRSDMGLSRVANEIANSDFIVFVDDFHYISRDIQENVGRQIKAAAELGIRFCIASVPHRSDDVVRSNHELRGRTINLDTSYWANADLVKIGRQGFDVLGFGVSEQVLDAFAVEACTSPQIMQSLCLELCFARDLYESVSPVIEIVLSPMDVSHVLLKTSTRADYSSLLKQMHAGPRVRGTERKEFTFSDQSIGDVYRAALLALRNGPPSMEFRYSDLLQRVSNVCVDEKPVGGSLTESLKQIANFADQMFPKQRIVEWDAEAASGTFAIIDPYFLFFLRSATCFR